MLSSSSSGDGSGSENTALGDDTSRGCMGACCVLAEKRGGQVLLVLAELAILAESELLNAVALLLFVDLIVETRDFVMEVAG